MFTQDLQRMSELTRAQAPYYTNIRKGKSRNASDFPLGAKWGLQGL